MSQLYGTAPKDLGLVDISPKEMMFWLYCPIKLPGQDRMKEPVNLWQFGDILEEVYKDIVRSFGIQCWLDNYIYITAKRLWVTPENPGNRPGWHSDGFMTDDLNYIWFDGNPTVFWEADELVEFTQDHVLSLQEMEDAAGAHNPYSAAVHGEPLRPRSGRYVTYPNKHLLRLDQGVIHRVADFEEPGMRTFVKISVSRHQYRLEGNSINHGLGLDWGYEERGVKRNAPESPSEAQKEGR